MAIKGADKVYIQVTCLLATENVIEREYRSLEAIKDNYPKFILSLDTVEFGNKNGIEWVNLVDFILGNYI